MDTLGLFSNADDLRVREQVLAKLSALCRGWVTRVSLDLGFPEAEAARAGVKLFTYGSYRLGVFNAASDIDALVVGPQHVTRNDFFTQFPDVLRQQPEATHVNPVTEAYVPVLKVVFGGIELDLQYASLPYDRIPETLSLKGDDFMRSLATCDDDKLVRAVNGTRDTDMLLELVPDRDVYRLALRLVRLWAKERGVYGNKVGFPGGFAWSVMLAHVCQMYPHACASTVLAKFFKTLMLWPWHERPVLLCRLVQQTDVFGSKLPGRRFAVWGEDENPRVKDLMPVITPAFPSMNSTHNVTESTKQLMLDEFERGRRLLEGAPICEESWYKLCERTNFFSRYNFFYRIDLHATTEERFSQWKGLVESKIRFLSLQVENALPGMLAQPLQEQFHPTDIKTITVQLMPRQTIPAPEHHATYFVGIKRMRGSTATHSITELQEQAMEFLHNAIPLNNLWDGKYISVRCVRRDEIPVSVRKESAERASVKPSLVCSNNNNNTNTIIALHIMFMVLLVHTHTVCKKEVVQHGNDRNHTSGKETLKGCCCSRLLIRTKKNGILFLTSVEWCWCSCCSCVWWCCWWCSFSSSSCLCSCPLDEHPCLPLQAL